MYKLKSAIQSKNRDISHQFCLKYITKLFVITVTGKEHQLMGLTFLGENKNPAQLISHQHL